MSQQNQLRLFDRVKEITYTQGTQDFALAGAADGFDALGRFYSHDEVIFYAATDGISYEVGSGVYKSADADPTASYNSLERYPFRSSNVDNGKINFNTGVKEIFVTYPATHSVIMGSGISPSLNIPSRKGVAVWDSANILNYFSNLTFDSALGSLGVNQPNHFYGVDVGGDGVSYSSRVRASGYFVGPTGIAFQSGNGANASLQLSKNPYTGGTQYVHFTPNLTDDQFTGDLTEHQTNAHQVIQVSGDVNQYILLKKQTAHTVFAGPIDDCIPSCSSDYPTFRPLVIDDLPVVDLSGIFAGLDDLLATSGAIVAYSDTTLATSGNFLQTRISGVQDNLTTHINGYASDFSDFETATNARIDASLAEAKHPRYCSVRGNSTDGNDDTWKNASKNQTVNWIKFPFAHVENESDTGDWDTTEYTYTAPSSGIYKIDASVYSHFNNAAGDVLNEFRLVTSGDGTITNYLSTTVYHQNVTEDEVNGSSSWVVDLDDGHKAYLEYKGQPRNFSKMTIHKT